MSFQKALGKIPYIHYYECYRVTIFYTIVLNFLNICFQIFKNDYYFDINHKTNKTHVQCSLTIKYKSNKKVFEKFIGIGTNRSDAMTDVFEKFEKLTKLEKPISLINDKKSTPNKEKSLLENQSGKIN